MSRTSRPDWAYLLSWVGGVIMLAGGGTNRFVRWSAAQSITLFLTWFVLYVVVSIAVGLTGMWIVLWPLFLLLRLAMFIAWLYTVITAFQGKEVRLPFVGDLTMRLFGSMLA